MDSCIPPIFASSPPPFDEHSLEDDENFSGYEKFSVLDGILDAESLNNSPEHTKKLKVGDVTYIVDQLTALPIVPPIDDTQSGDTVASMHDLSKECPNSSTSKPVEVIPDFSVPPPFDDTEFDEYEDFQCHKNLDSPEPEHVFSTCNGSVPYMDAMQVKVIEQVDEVEALSVELSVEPPPEPPVEDPPKESLCSETSVLDQSSPEPDAAAAIDNVPTSDKDDWLHTAAAFQPVEITSPFKEEVSGERLKDEDSEPAKAAVVDDNFTDFDSYFDTRPQVEVELKIVDQSSQVFASAADASDSFGDFAAFDAFSQSQAFESFSTNEQNAGDDFDDFGDFVEVSSQAALPPQPEIKTPPVLGPLPLSPSACLQVLDSVFSGDEQSDSSEIVEKINIFSNGDQGAFFDKVTDFDHASGLTVKWSWTETFFGRNILEFVGIDTKNVIKTDKGYIYVPDFASDLSFTPLKPEKISFPTSTAVKKPEVAVKAEPKRQDYQEQSQLTSVVQNQPHRPLPLSLNVGTLPKDSALKAENIKREENDGPKGKPIDIEEFLSLPTISSILTNPLQRQIGGKVLSEEAKRILYLIPNISYMTSNQLCFPVLDMKDGDNQSLI